jgi:hypothetical protein
MPGRILNGCSNPDGSRPKRRSSYSQGGTSIWKAGGDEEKSPASQASEPDAATQIKGQAAVFFLLDFLSLTSRGD